MVGKWKRGREREVHVCMYRKDRRLGSVRTYIYTYMRIEFEGQVHCIRNKHVHVHVHDLYIYTPILRNRTGRRWSAETSCVTCPASDSQ